MRPPLTLVTVTYNAASVLPELVQSLDAQTDRNFEWVVVDGCSTDTTAAIAQSARTPPRVIVEHDKGIYDALNKAIERIEAGYYLVVGADDILYPSAVAELNAALANRPCPIVTGGVRFGSTVLRGGRGRVWYRGMLGAISQHSVGAAFDVRLHARHGLYSQKYGSAGDNHFVMRCLGAGEQVTVLPALLGEFRTQGTSSQDPVGNVFQNSRIAVELGGSALVQLAVLALKLTALKRLY